MSVEQPNKKPKAREPGTPIAQGSPPTRSSLPRIPKKMEDLDNFGLQKKQDWNRTVHHGISRGEEKVLVMHSVHSMFIKKLQWTRCVGQNSLSWL